MHTFPFYRSGKRLTASTRLFHSLLESDIVSCMFFMWSDTSREENIRTVGTSSKDLVNVSSSTLPAEAAKISNGQM
jgi:hypothetical protein